VVLNAGAVITEGTAQQLKDQMGGAMLEARVTKRADLPPRLNTGEGLAGVPTQAGIALLVAAANRFEEEHVPLDDLGIRRPSLDDVFLALTAARTTPGAHTTSAPTTPTKRRLPKSKRRSPK
jgi:ABC-2 type transport system ATP-binding protein